MKSIEKSLTSFLKGNSPRVSEEDLCLYASKSEKHANETIDILFSVINDYLDYYTGSSDLSKVRDLLKCVSTVMLSNDLVDRGIVVRKISKLNYKLDHIGEEHKKRFIDYDTAISELQKTMETLDILMETSVNTENEQYELINVMANVIKNLQLFEFTSNRIPNLVNAKDNDKNCLFKNILINYLDSVMKTDEEDVYYYSNLLSIIMNNRDFKLSVDDKKECLNLIYQYINKFSCSKKSKKQHFNHIEFLYTMVDSIKGENKEKKEITELAKKYNIRVGFDPEFYEMARLAKIPMEGVMTDREEIDDFIITIDKDSAVEIDDGLSCKRLSNGNYLLGVHIASPLAYFPYESEIIQEALSRNESLFLPYKYQEKEDDFTRIIPIFPYQFSAKNASLTPNKRRLARSYYFELDSQGNIINEEFKKTIITSSYKASYEFIDYVIKNGSKDKNLDTLVKNLVKVTKILDNKYQVSQLYEQIKQNSDDFSTNVVKNVGSQNIVNKTMLLTGNRVAEFFYNNNYPCIYRVHEVNESDIIRIEALLDNLTRTYGKNSNDEIYKIIAQSGNGIYPSGWYAMEGAHYGLGLNHYCRCTSTLRRSADIVVEHALEVCYDNTPTEEELKKLKLEIDERCNLINSKQESTNWFVKDYKVNAKRRR